MIPRLETERLILRGMIEADIVEEQAFLATDRAAFVGGPMHKFDVWRYCASLMGHWKFRGFGLFAIEEKVTGRYLGRAGPWFPQDWPEPEIGWTMMANAEGKGFAREAAEAARAWAYTEKNLDKMISLIDPANTRSIALAERLGAKFECEFEHFKFGTMSIWRHPSKAELGL